MFRLFLSLSITIALSIQSFANSNLPGDRIVRLSDTVLTSTQFSKLSKPSQKLYIEYVAAVMAILEHAQHPSKIEVVETDSKKPKITFGIPVVNAAEATNFESNRTKNDLLLSGLAGALQAGIGLSLGIPMAPIVLATALTVGGVFAANKLVDYVFEGKQKIPSLKLLP